MSVGTPDQPAQPPSPREQPANPPAGSARSWRIGDLAKRVGHVKTFVVGVAAVIAALLAILKGVPELEDQWNRTFGDPTPTPVPTATPPLPVAEGVIVEESLKLGRAVTLGDLCRSNPDPACDAVEPEDYPMPGYLVSFEVESQGFVGQELPLRYSLRVADTDVPFPDPSVPSVDAWPTRAYQPTETSDRNPLEIWVPRPPVPGTFVLRVELYEPDGTTLVDAAQTEPFVVS